MKFSIVAITSVVALVSANPVAIVEIAERQAAPPLCSGTTGTPVCCATDVLGLADLDCATPPSTPTSLASFTSICAAIGQRARCCALPILGQALICGNPT